MGKNIVNVNIDKLRVVAKNVKGEAVESKYNSNELRSLIFNNEGDARNELFTLNGDTEICANVTRQLIECTARFLEEAASYYETADNEIAKVVSEN